MQITFIIPLKPVSWNTLARKNHWAYTKVFDEWKKATWESLIEKEWTKENAKFITPVQIHAHAEWKEKRRHDLDNILVKPILDQLVAMEILPDDSLSVIEKISITGKTGAKQNALTITIKAI